MSEIKVSAWGQQEANNKEYPSE